MARRKPGYDTRYQKARAHMLARDPVCAHCQTRVATRADHQPPLSLHVHRPGSGCCVIIPSCYECERIQAGQLGGLGAVLPVRVEFTEPSGFGRKDAVWDVPWLAGLRRRVPPEAVWPRLMTVPHPRAVGSLGAEVAEWARVRRGVSWRWWQKLMAARLFEVDAEGVLVWENALMTVARQVGKTWLLRDLCDWRLEHEDHFGAEQLVLSTGKDLAVVREMQRPARIRAKSIGKPLYHVREVNGQEEIEFRCGSRWMIRAKSGVYGLSASMATVDEAWKVSAAAIDDGLVPTMVERPQAQLLLTSTAHRQATALMIGRRATALEQLGDPDELLLVEWSAPRDCELEDRAAWRLASPHWTPKRERVIAARLAAALAGESDDPEEPDPVESFRTQWLNQWPARRVAVAKGEELVGEAAWQGCEGSIVPVGVGWVALADNRGEGAAVAFAAADADGVFEVDGVECETWEEGLVWARKFVEAAPGACLVVTPTMAPYVPLDFPNRAAMRPAQSADVFRALSLLRDLVATGRLVHDRTAALDGQVLGARVRATTTGGLALVPTGRSDLLRAVLSALWVAVQPAAVAGVH